MKSYPSIDRPPSPVPTAYIFGKLDGSNIRAEWTPKKGFHKFGKRKGLLDDSYPILKRAPALILEKYGEDLARVFKAQRWRKVTAFFEFYGPSSFAGWHDPEEKQTVVLFDVAVDNRGILEPRDFVRVFQGIDHAPLLHMGNWNQILAKQVREGTLPGMPLEGVVVKGKCVSPGRPMMFKFKSQEWLDRLKADCGEDEELFEARR